MIQWMLRAAAAYGIAAGIMAIYLALVAKGMLETARHPDEENAAPPQARN